MSWSIEGIEQYNSILSSSEGHVLTKNIPVRHRVSSRHGSTHQLLVDF